MNYIPIFWNLPGYILQIFAWIMATTQRYWFRLSKTNNAIEGWHNTFDNTSCCSKKRNYLIIGTLKKWSRCCYNAISTTWWNESSIWAKKEECRKRNMILQLFKWNEKSSKRSDNYFWDPWNVKLINSFIVSFCKKSP